VCAARNARLFKTILRDAEKLRPLIAVEEASFDDHAQ
jgi:hypothetical protein